MQVRKTSIEAYHRIESEGLLSRLRFFVYSALYHYGPLTKGELYARHLSHLQQHSVNPRYAELERLGVIEVVGKRACEITGVDCLVWDVTGNLPTKFKKPKSKLKQALEEIEDLKRENEFLRQCLGQPRAS